MWLFIYNINILGVWSIEERCGVDWAIMSIFLDVLGIALSMNTESSSSPPTAPLPSTSSCLSTMEDLPSLSWTFPKDVLISSTSSAATLLAPSLFSVSFDDSRGVIVSENENSRWNVLNYKLKNAKLQYFSPDLFSFFTSEYI